jgi:putative ABC transport system permease protein
MAHKLRSIFMIICVAIGIAALTVIISLGKGTEEKIMTQVKKLFSSNTIMVVAGKARMESNQRLGGSLSGLKLEDFGEIKNRVNDVVDWDAVQISPDRQAAYEGRNTIAIISGQTPSAETVWNIEVTDGRFFTEAEDKNLSRVALIAPNIAKELFGDANPIGSEIKVENISFEIIGLVAPRGMDPHGIDKDSEIIIPLNTLLRRVVNLDFLMLGKIVVDDEKNIPSTAKEIEQVLRERHGIDANGANDFMIVTPTMINEMVKSSNRIFNTYLPLVALISLLVGSIVVSNLMLISVNERRKEIGLRMAVGAKTKYILVQFLLESSSITILSGILGIGLGLFILSIVYPKMGIPYSVSWTTIILCSVISTLIGIAAGYFPAKKAAKLKSIEALN